jgi:hypothetical protein
MPDSRVYISNVDTLADLIDRLIVEISKMAWFENEKRKEKNNPNRDLDTLLHWDDLSRDCNELRALIKVRINTLMSDIVREGSYTATKEIRTFSPSNRSVADVIDDMCLSYAEKNLRGELVGVIKAAVENE